MIVGGQTEAHALTIIDYHEPFDQGFRLKLNDFLNIPKTFEPFQDSSGFSEVVSKTSEKVPKQC